jgi:mono/diheme cytochrome c family protein
MPSRAKRARLIASLLATSVAGCSGVAGVSRRAPNAQEAELSMPVPLNDYRDGHARPRALAFNGDDRLLYVALSTADQVAVVDPLSSPPRLLTKIDACRFPDAIAALPKGGALVGCRFDPGLMRIGGDATRGFRASPLAPALPAGARGLALAPDGKTAYVASPPLRGVAVVALDDGRVLQTMPTGISPRALRLVPKHGWPGSHGALLVVSNFIDHTVTVHSIGDDDRLATALQTIRTEAPVLDIAVSGGELPQLLLFTHEDRPVSRARGPVEGLDSGVIRLTARGDLPDGRLVEDPGPGRRPFLNLGDRAQPVIELAGAASIGGPLAIVGAGSDNLLVGDGLRYGEALSAAVAVPVGANPTAVAALPDGRFVTADRLSDTLTFVSVEGAPGVEARLVVGTAARPSLAERGELLFYSRALVPHNVATGPLSLYTCAACHDDGHIDGRLHPAKQNRFFSTTLTCRGLATTAPFLRLGNQATLDVFADNIVSTHAQGAERDPAHFADYPVAFKVWDENGAADVTLSPAELRAALARYMERIPPEPSPFVAATARALSADARRGLTIFRDDCAACHRLIGSSERGDRVDAAALEGRLLAGEVALTSPGRYAVGTPILGEGGNNPPSLRGVWDAAPYFSDGSARTLEEALRRTDPGAAAVHAPANAARPPAFSADEQAALLALLRSL